MQKGWRKRAEFYARLASLESLDTLQAWEGLKLEADAGQIGEPWPSSPAAVAGRIAKSRRRERLPALPPAELQEERLAGTQRAILWTMIRAVYPYARRWITDLLDAGVTADLPPGAIPGEPVLKLENGIVRRAQRKVSTSHPGFPQLEAILDLYWILHRDPFPFQRCPQCRAIFVPFRKQRYCTPLCARAAMQAVRRETRREYMRQYMRGYAQKRRHTEAKKTQHTTGAVVAYRSAGDK